MSGSLNGLAHQALGVDCKAAASTVSVTASSTVIIAAGAAPGLYRIVPAGDIYIRQGEDAAVASGHLFKSGVADFIDHEAGAAVNAIAGSATDVVVGKCQTVS